MITLNYSFNKETNTIPAQRVRFEKKPSSFQSKSKKKRVKSALKAMKSLKF